MTNIKKTFLTFFIFFFCFLFFNYSFAQENKIGFIPSIWLSKEKPKEGETITIYTSIWNQTKIKFQGKVVFLDKDEILGEKEFFIDKEEIKIVSLDWKVTSGNHILQAQIIELKSLNKNNLENQDFNFFSNKSTPQLKFDVESQKEEKSKEFTKKSIENIFKNIFLKIENWRLDKKNKVEAKIQNLPQESFQKKIFSFLLIILTKKVYFYLVTSIVLLLAFKVLLRSFKNKLF